MKMERKDMVLGILTDAVIFERTLRGVREILGAFTPYENEWYAAQQYNGCANAYGLMAPNSELSDGIAEMLFDVYHKIIMEDFNSPCAKRRDSRTLAELVLVCWEKELVHYR